MLTTPVQVQGVLTNGINDSSGLGMVKVLTPYLLTPPRVSQMIETDAVNTLLSHKPENFGDFLIVGAGNGET